MKKILFLVNHEIAIYNFRKELVERLLQKGHEVVISSPSGERIEMLKQMGCRHVEVSFDRHGMNPFAELKLLMYYKRLIAKENPDIIFSYTIKPNIYGSLAAKKNKIPIVVTTTGLGSAVEKPGIVRQIILLLYKCAWKEVQTCFIQNTENYRFFVENRIYPEKIKRIPGSGVNLSHYAPIQYPPDITIEFVFIARIMKEKGIDEYLSAAEAMRAKYPQTRFHICGFYEEDYEEKIKALEKREIIHYHGMVSDTREILAKVHCTVLPSYHEGMSNVLLESAACARPVIASAIAGCQETFDEGISGFGVKPRDKKDLEDVMEKFVLLSYDQKAEMGIAGRRKVEKNFDRKFVIDAYMRELE